MVKISSVNRKILSVIDVCQSLLLINSVENVNPLLPNVPQMVRLAKILILILGGHLIKSPCLSHQETPCLSV